MRRESLATARIRHPNVVQLYDVHHVDGTVCLSLEHVDGPSLEDVGCGPFPAELVAAVGHQVASGLAAAHTLHVVHRDIRPANLFLASSGHVKIANFTLSKLLDTSEQGITVETSLRDRFGYIAPEQLSDAPVGAAADIYALGLILWEALNGHLPWHQTDPLPAAALRRLHEPLPPASTGIDPHDTRMVDIIARATHLDPADRYPSADALAEDLREISGTRPHELVRTYLLDR
jgi:eukaryotic-like serine/threonine-protein kinase